MATRVLRCFSKLGGHDEIIMFSPTNYLELTRAAELKAECGGAAPQGCSYTIHYEETIYLRM